MVSSRVLRRLRKARDSSPQDTAPASFPFTRLPYELQLLIAKQAVLSPTPIVVGTRINTSSVDPAAERASRRAGAMLGTCRDFSTGELRRHYYRNNVFELGYYYEQRSFLRMPGKELVRHVLVDMLRVLVWPTGGANMIVEKLGTLPALRRVTVRVRPLGSASVFNASMLRAVLVTMCRLLESLECIELLVEAGSGSRQEAVWECERLLETGLTPEDIWQGGVPQAWKPVMFTVSYMAILCSSVGSRAYLHQVTWQESSAADSERRRGAASNQDSTGAKLKTWIDGRLATQTRRFM
ncbi:MAG: hypothetical protein LQ340_003865 [Diploschistes diacapsis]|nr:MAG: hypothetical protein LQ340_003865 [Diploschistes diacapsis]